MEQENNPPSENRKSKSSVDLDPKVAAVLSYLLGWVSGLIFLLLEKENRFVRFHAAQSIVTFGSLTLLNLVAGVIPILGGIIHFLIWPVTLILWIVLMVKAYQEEWYRLPVAGEISEKLL
ncbi:hypothetical protein GCM10007416_22830 [Kroppenstedtia guangzhouensis]|uniref:DUF4870 domain-containing protein n=1 Tax=Kroppenstedtia guangzhouensis TaxID=1274356 RepID=A0ABQ1GTC0_9BACL|nr:DUF4870 domain-containing protein [Kroppenstedtia guangzhouensis]GGA49138.1 hypothetical protein GCM10007416_22830 [Kroppenstedtia guangzhouensis]